MTDEDWPVGYAKSLMVFLNGDAIPDPGPYGEQVPDDSSIVLINAHFEPLAFRIPDGRYADLGSPVLATDTQTQRFPAEGGATVMVEDRSLEVWKPADLNRGSDHGRQPGDPRVPTRQQSRRDWFERTGMIRPGSVTAPTCERTEQCQSRRGRAVRPTYAPARRPDGSIGVQPGEPAGWTLVARQAAGLQLPKKGGHHGET